MDERLARNLFDERLKEEGQRHATEGEWNGVFSLPSIQAAAEFSPTPEEDFADEAANVICLMREVAASNPRPPRGSVTRRGDPLSPPEWWEMESQRRLGMFCEQRVWMRVDAGLFDAPKDDKYPGALYALRVSAPDDAVEGKGPFAPLGSVAEIAPLVRGMIRRQHERFRSFAKEPPWGWDPDDFLEYEAEMEFPAETWEHDRRTEHEFFLPAGFAAVSGGVGEDWAALDRLHLRSTWIARELGISQAECLVWGLTGRPFAIPWMPTVSRSGPWGDWPTLTIQVNSVSATAQDVAIAYTRARGDSNGQNATHRAPGPWPAFMTAFVQARLREAPDEAWEERFRAFARAFPDQPYASMRTFRQTYYKQMKQQRNNEGGSHDGMH